MATAVKTQQAISDRITTLTGVADTAISDLNTWLAEIKLASMTYASMEVASPTFGTFTDNIKELPPAVPDFTKVTEVKDPVIPAVLDFTELAPTDNANSPTNSFTYTEAVYMPAALPVLKLVDVETEISDSGSELNDLMRRDAILEERAKWAARGFNLAGGQLLRGIRDAQLKYVVGRLDKSKEAAFRSATLTLDQKKENINTSIALEREILSYYNEVAQRALKAAETTVQLGVDIFHAIVMRTKIQNSIRQVNADVYAEKLKGSQIDAEIYKAKVYAYAEKLKGLIGTYNAMIQAYNVDIDRSKTETDLKVYQQNIQWMQDDMSMKTTLANGIANLNAFLEFQKIKTGADLASANILRQKISAALQAFNVISHLVITTQKSKQG